VAAAADPLIPAGACVLTDDAAYTVAADRFLFRPGAPGAGRLVRDASSGEGNAAHHA
jgi:hypothetical protein